MVTIWPSSLSYRCQWVRSVSLRRLCLMAKNLFESYFLFMRSSVFFFSSSSLFPSCPSHGTEWDPSTSFYFNSLNQVSLGVKQVALNTEWVLAISTAVRFLLYSKICIVHPRNFFFFLDTEQTPCMSLKPCRVTVCVRSSWLSLGSELSTFLNGSFQCYARSCVI